MLVWWRLPSTSPPFPHCFYVVLSVYLEMNVKSENMWAIAKYLYVSFKLMNHCFFFFLNFLSSFLLSTENVGNNKSVAKTSPAARNKTARSCWQRSKLCRRQRTVWKLWAGELTGWLDDDAFAVLVIFDDFHKTHSFPKMCVFSWYLQRIHVDKTCFDVISLQETDV